MIALLHALKQHQSVSVGVLAAAGTAAKPWLRSLCKHTNDGRPPSFKRTGRNARKQKRRFFVFPELAPEEHASKAPKPVPTTAIVTSLLQDLRLPSVALPVRYFLEAEKQRPGDASQESSPRSMGGKDPEWVIAVPDTRGLHRRSAGTTSNSLEALRSHVAKADSLRYLVNVMELGKDRLMHDPSFVATAFCNIEKQLRASEAAQYARYPASIAAALPHVSAALKWQGQLQQDAQAARSAQLLPETALRVAQQYLLPTLETPATLKQLSAAQMADIAAALAVLQKQASYTLAPSFWQHVRTFAESEEQSILRIVNMGATSRISSVVQQSITALPEDAATAASLLHASRTWLHPSNVQTAVATIPTLSPEDTVWCLLAMHTRRDGLEKVALSPEPALERFSVPNGGVQNKGAAGGNFDTSTPVWTWIDSNRVAVDRKIYSINKKHVRNLLRQRIQDFTPRERSLSARVTPDPDLEGGIPSAMHPNRASSHTETSEKLSWPEHAPLLFAGLSMPISSSNQRSALRPLFGTSAACIMSERALSGSSMEAGHWIGLLDLTSCSMAAMSSSQHESAVAVVNKTCEELQAQLDVLGSHHVASSVLLLGEILTKQGHRNDITCDAAYKYLSNIFRSDAVAKLQLNAPELLMLSSGIRRLFGVHCQMWQKFSINERYKDGHCPSTGMQGFGKPLPIPHLHAFTRSVANRSLELISEPSLENAEAMRSILSMVGDVHLRYQQVVPFLRRCTALLHEHLKSTEGSDHSTKALAHILLALGQLRVPFDTVYPLVLSVCDILHDRTPSMDVTEVYLIVDALAKLKAPTPEVAPLLLSMMAHLSQGLDIRPTKPALHMNILTTPTSQLLKLAHSIKNFMPQTHGLLTIEMQAAPKAAFMRSLLSHIMRLRVADLNHRDLLHLLQLVKDSRLGRDLPKPWTQDSALRVLDRLHAHLFDGEMKEVSETMYWQDQPLYDLMYTGMGAPPPIQLQPASVSMSGNLAFPQSSSSFQSQSGNSVALQSGERRLVSDDIFPKDHTGSSLEPTAPPYTTYLPNSNLLSDPAQDLDPWSPVCPVPQQPRPLNTSDYTEPTERWAYRKVYGIVRDSQTVILGSLRVLDWDAQVTHAVKTISENLGPRGMNASFSVLDNTPQSSTVTHQRWRQIEYSGQDYSPEELFNYTYKRLREKERRGGPRVDPRGDGRGRGRRRGRGRSGKDEYRLGVLQKPNEFIVPTVPEIETMDLSKTSTLLQTHCRFRPVDGARLLVAIAELYSDSASAGRELMHALGPKLFSQFPLSKHNVPDLARMIWALGMLARPGCGLEQALPALHTAISRCKANITMMDPKFTMLAAKGLALMARGGMVMHATHAQHSSQPMLWPALTQAPQNSSQNSAMLKYGAVASDAVPDVNVEHAQELARAARAYMTDALEHFSSSSSNGSLVALKLRPEGLAEALAAGTILGDPERLELLRDVWRIAIDSLETNDLPQDVPLRATSALLSSAIHLLHATKENNLLKGNSFDGQPEFEAQVPPSSVAHRHMMQEVCHRAPVVTRVARERLLHNKRRPTVLQTRAFSAALLKLAEEGVPVEDAGLVQALVAMSVGAPAVWNAKQRGIGGARRLVLHLEDLAALKKHGVVFQGAEQGSSSSRRADGNARVRVNVDASLLQCMEALWTGVESAAWRGSTTSADDPVLVAQVDGSVDAENMSAAAILLPTQLPEDTFVGSKGTEESHNTHEGTIVAIPIADEASNGTTDHAEGYPEAREGSLVKDISLIDSSNDLNEEHEGEYEFEDEEEIAEEDGRVIVEKLDESLQAVVDRTPWRQGAWSPEFAQRLFTALNTLSARNDSEGS